MEQKRKFRKSLLLTIIGGVLGLIVLLSADVGVASYMEFTRVIKNQYTETAASIGTYISMGLPREKLDEYLETGTTDSDYDLVQQAMTEVAAAAECRRIFVAKVDTASKELVFLHNVSQNSGDENMLALGDRSAVDEAFMEAYERMLRGEQTYYSAPCEASEGTCVFVAVPVRDGDEIVAIVGIVKIMTQMDSARQHLIKTSLLIQLTLAILCCIGWTIYMWRAVLSPIRKLENAANTMVAHLKDGTAPDIRIKEDNEIKGLADSFTKMYHEVGDYIEQLADITAEKERIGAELDVATKIQASMLPCIFPAFPDREEFEIFASMDPAKEVGGDFYDFFMVDDDHLAFVVADVSGKGVPAALFMVIGKTLIKDHTAPGKDLGEVFAEVNNILCSSNSEEMFITAFEGVLNLKTGELRYVNAGHETPFICRKDGIYEPFKVRAGFVLAGMEDIKYRAGSIQLEPGDSIFQYSDGIPEATAAGNEQYGMDRLGEILAKNSSKLPEELLPAVKADVDAFVADAPQFDDITMLCVKYLGPSGEASK